VTVTPRMQHPAIPPEAHAAGRSLRRVSQLPLNIALLLAAVTFLPLLVPHGPRNSAPADIFIALYLFVALLGWTRPGRPLVFPLTAVVAFICVISLAGAGLSQLPRVGLATVVIDVYLFVFFLAVVNDLRGDRQALAMVLSAWSIASLGWALLANGVMFNFLPTGLATLILDNSQALKRASATADNPNLAASYFVVSFFVLLASSRPRTRWIRALGGLWLVLAVYSTGSVAGLLALASGGVLLLAVWFLRHAGSTLRQVQVVMAVLVLALAVGVAGVSRVMFTRAILEDVATVSQSQQQGGIFQQSLGRSNRSLRGRLTLWTQGLQSSSDRGQALLGVGAGEAKYTVDYKSLHNDLLSYLVERGLLGLTGLLLLYCVVGRLSIRLLVQRGPGARFEPLAAGVIGNLVFSMTHQTLHFRHVWLLFALVWVGANLKGTGESPEPVPESKVTTQGGQA
jgi:O-antigen ligase